MGLAGSLSPEKKGERRRKIERSSWDAVLFALAECSLSTFVDLLFQEMTLFLRFNRAPWELYFPQ